MPSLFDGIRILDLTKVLSGPLATRMFADYGAEVLKIESRTHFDDARHFPPLSHGWSGYYEVLNRNKKGLLLDLSDPSDLEAFYGLCEQADIVVENMAPRTKHALKIDFETVRTRNPRLIYASLSGHGQADPRKYYDVIAQAESGLMSLNGFADEPLKIGPPVVDAFSGMTLAFAISSALFYRERTGKGQFIDVSMLGCAMNLLESNLVDYSLHKQNPVRTGHQDNQIAPFGTYKTQDGAIAIAVGNDPLWETLASFLAKHRTFSAERFRTNQSRLKHSQELTSLLEEVFSAQKTSALVEALSRLGIPCSRVNSMADVYAEERHYGTGRLVAYAIPHVGTCVVPGSSISFSAADQMSFQPAPSLGEDANPYAV